MATIHISAADAALHLPVLLARVRAGIEVVIEDAVAPAVVLRVAEERPVRLLSESLRRIRARGSQVALDATFGQDLEAIVQSHPQPLDCSWD